MHVLELQDIQQIREQSNISYIKQTDLTTQKKKSKISNSQKQNSQQNSSVQALCNVSISENQVENQQKKDLEKILKYESKFSVNLDKQLSMRQIEQEDQVKKNEEIISQREQNRIKLKPNHQHISFKYPNFSKNQEQEHEILELEQEINEIIKNQNGMEDEQGINREQIQELIDSYTDRYFGSGSISNRNQDKNKNIIEIIQKNKINNYNQEQLQSISRKSSRSTNSPIGFKQLNYMIHQKKFGKSIINLICHKIVVIILMFSYLFINYFIVESKIYNQLVFLDNLSNQEKNIAYVINPTLFNQNFQQINYLQIVLIVEKYLEELQLSPFIHSYIDFVVEEIQTNIQKDSQILFQTMAQIDNIYPKFNLLVIQDLKIQSINVTHTQYLEIFQDYLFNFIQIYKDNEFDLNNSKALSNILFFKINIEQQTNLISNIIEYTGDIIESYQGIILSELLMLIIIEILLYICVLIFSFYLWYNHYIKERIILLMCTRYQEKDALQTFLQNKTLMTYLNEVENQQSFSMDYNRLYYGNSDKDQAQKQRDIKKMDINLSSRIDKTQIDMKEILFIVTLILIIMTLYIMGFYLFFEELNKGLTVLVQLNFSGTKLKQSVDDLISISEIIKTDPFLLDNVYNLTENVNYNREEEMRELLSIFNQTYLQFEKYQHIVVKSVFLITNLNEQQKNEIYDMVKSNLCYVSGKLLYFCNQGADRFKNFGIPFKEDNNSNIVERGLKIMFAELQSLYSETFFYELNNQQYQTDLNKSKLFLNSPVHQLFLSYNLEIKNVLNKLVRDLNQYSLNEIGNILSYLSFYGFLLGTGLNLLSILMYYYLIKTNFNNYYLIKQGLLLIPYHILNQQNMQRSIKSILK